jgi:hypothetical protein
LNVQGISGIQTGLNVNTTKVVQGSTGVQSNNLGVGIQTGVNVQGNSAIQTNIKVNTPVQVEGNTGVQGGSNLKVITTSVQGQGQNQGKLNTGIQGNLNAGVQGQGSLNTQGGLNLQSNTGVSGAQTNVKVNIPVNQGNVTTGTQGGLNLQGNSGVYGVQNNVKVNTSVIQGNLTTGVQGGSNLQGNSGVQTGVKTNVSVPVIQGNVSSGIQGGAQLQGNLDIDAGGKVNTNKVQGNLNTGVQGQGGVNLHGNSGVQSGVNLGVQSGANIGGKLNVNDGIQGQSATQESGIRIGVQGVQSGFKNNVQPGFSVDTKQGTSARRLELEKPDLNLDVKAKGKAKYLEESDIKLNLAETDTMDNRAFSQAIWNQKAINMQKKADFTTHDIKLDLEIEKKRQRKKLLKLGPKDNEGRVEPSFMVEQLKKDVQEDGGYAMEKKSYSTFDINKANQINIKRQLKEQLEAKEGKKINLDMQIEMTQAGHQHGESIAPQATTTGMLEKQKQEEKLPGPPTNAIDKDENGNLVVHWHLCTKQELFSVLETQPTGLTPEIHEERLRTNGPNIITPVPKMHWIVKFILNLIGGFQIFLWAGFILCVIVYCITNYVDYQTLTLGVICAVVVFGTAVFSQYQEGKADDVMEALKALTPENVYCFRGKDQPELVPASSLVLGDIVSVKGGEKVPADVRIIKSSDLKVNNASLTGENIDIKLGEDANAETLYEAKNVARMGCNFTNGSGVAIIFSTGDNTFFGQIAKSTTSIERPESCLTHEIHRFIYSIYNF